MSVEQVIELKYSNTNTYLIRGIKGSLLFDTGWAGTFPAFCKALGEAGASLQEIKYLLISHFHPDHMGIAGELMAHGIRLVVPEVQRDFIHSADAVFEKEKNTSFLPIRNEEVRVISFAESRSFLGELGLSGEIFSTPGHSDDSISLWLEEARTLFVGDLNPLYELELHRGTQVGESWERLLALRPVRVYYGHAKAAVLEEGDLRAGSLVGEVEAGKQQRENAFGKIVRQETAPSAEQARLYFLVKNIMKYIDKGYSMEKIRKKTGADAVFIEDVTRMYLTHQNVGVQGILDRIEIKGK